MLNEGSGRYRAEIDGLRALAILPVVLFHFDVRGFQGGFIGVDVFFVISGFLIGGILWSELCETGRIRLGRFYMRRIRRLAPAYFLMIAGTLAVAWQIMLPFEFREFGKELIASTVYLSNVYFFLSSGYFDQLSEQRLLLHTWSLSVEEQFYIVLPFVLIALARWRKAIPVILVLLAVVSLVACIWMTTRSQPAAFYLFPFRAWELLFGVILAVVARNLSFDFALHGVLSFLGLALLLGGVALIPKGEGFPGAYALVPVVGTTLLLMNGRHDNAVNRLLKIGALRFFGLISYSLYLWHWPVAVLAKYYWADGLSLPGTAALIALSVGLAFLSWKFVETPVRRGLPKTPALLGGAALASALSLGAGALLFKGDGLVGRFGPQTQTHIRASADFNQDWSRCGTAREGPFAGIELCPIGPDGPPRVLIWGDSHVRALKEGLEQAAFDAGTPGLVIWNAGCPPLVGVTKDETAASQIEDERCAQANARIAAALPALDTVETLLLAARWSYYAHGTGTGRDAHNLIEVRANGDGAAGLTGLTQQALVAAALDRSLSRYGQEIPNIFVLNQIPEIAGYHSGVAARFLAHGQMDPDQLTRDMARVPRADVDARAAPVQEVLAQAVASGTAQVLDPVPYFCGPEWCSALHEGEAAYFDNNHLTNTTARRIRDLFAPVFATSAAAGS